MQSRRRDTFLSRSIHKQTLCYGNGADQDKLDCFCKLYIRSYSRRVFDTVWLLYFLLGTHTETWIRFSCIWTIISNKEQYTLKCKIGNAMKFHRKVMLISQISNFIVIKTISCGSICVFCCDQSDGCNAITWPGCCYTRLWVMCACLRVPLDSRFLTHTPTCRLKNHMRLLYLSNDCLKLLDYVRKGKPVLGCKIHASVLLVLHVNVYRIYRQTSPKQGKTQFYTRAANGLVRYNAFSSFMAK